MERQKLYSPPNGSQPFELPDFWDFKNGTVINNLQTLSDQDLQLLGFDGPFYDPIEKVIHQNSSLSDKERLSIKNSMMFTFDSENDIWISNYSYDSETHKYVWYSKERRYIIVPIDEDTSIYETLYPRELATPVNNNYNLLPPEVSFISSKNTCYIGETITLSWEVSGTDISSVTIEPEIGNVDLIGSIEVIPLSNVVYKIIAKNLSGSISTKYLNIKTNLRPILWEEFKKQIIISKDFNEYMSSIFTSLPIIATSLPVAISDLENGNYSNFTILWNLLKTSEFPPPEKIIKLLNEVAILCNLPQDFLSLIR